MPASTYINTCTHVVLYVSLFFLDPLLFQSGASPMEFVGRLFKVPVLFLSPTIIGFQPWTNYFFFTEGWKGFVCNNHAISKQGQTYIHMHTKVFFQFPSTTGLWLVKHSRRHLPKVLGKPRTKRLQESLSIQIKKKILICLLKTDKSVMVFIL